MKLSPHLTFFGQCEAAFRFYEQTLGGTDLRLFPYGKTPMASELSPEWRTKIVHASLTVADSTLAGADVLPEQYEAPRGFFVLFGASNPTEAERVFNALADGGVVRMPLQQTFWSPSYGVVVDRFGTPWEISSEPASATRSPST